MKLALPLMIILFILYSHLMGPADLGFRAAPMDLKLSQKYPPAVALETIRYTTLEVDSSNEKGSFTVDALKVIPLKAGYPELGTISLDELNFSFNDSSSSTSKGTTKDATMVTSQRDTSPRVSRYPSSNRIMDEVPENYFSEEEKNRLQMAGLSNDLEVDDLHPPYRQDLSERVKALIAQEGFDKNPNADSSTQFSEKKQALASSKNNNQKNSDHQSSDRSPSDRSPSDSQPTPPKPLVIRGELEFAKDSSLALTDQHFIDVRRFEEGISKEVAKVDLVNGTFSMNLQSTRGVIIGRLTNKKGKVDGEGSVSVLELVNSQHPKLILKKNPDKSIIQPSSIYGNSGWDKNKKGGLATQLFLVGATPTPPPSTFNSSSLTKDPRNEASPVNSTHFTSKLFNNVYDTSSDFVLEAQADFHRSTIAITNLTKSSEIPLLPERMINGLSEILLEQDIPLNLDRGDSLIWGIVKEKGRAVEGAKVISTQGGRTSYFGGFYLPDQTRQATSENGMFVVSLSNPGWNELLIELKDGRQVHFNTLVFSSKVSYVEANIPDQSLAVTVRTFDALTGDPLRADLDFQQLSEPTRTYAEGFVNLELPSTNHLSFLQITPESPYEKVRMAYTHLTDYIHVPLFTKNWMDFLKSSIKIDDQLRTGNIVGFVQGDDFIVEIQNKESQSKIIYFDQQGHPAPQGVAGGGFVVFNLEEDQVNLAIVSLKTEKEIIRIVRPEREWTSVISANFD